jgi:hypothetical protein
VGSLREEIHTRTELVAGLAALKLNQNNLSREIESVCRDVKDIKEKVSEVLLEKERWITAGKIVQERMKKDIEAAHVMIGGIQEAGDADSLEARPFMGVPRRANHRRTILRGSTASA